MKLFPRGLPYFVDNLLKGSARFSKRTGNSIAVLNPDNTYLLAEDTQAQTDQVTLKIKTDWIQLRSLIEFGPGKEIVQVKDFSSSTNTITFYQQLVQAYTQSLDHVVLHSVPIIVDFNSSIGNTTLLVKTHFYIVNGDIITYALSTGLIDSITESRVVQATYAGTTTDPYFTFLYTLTLETPLKKSLSEGEEIFLRAYPAYQSVPIRVPNLLTSSESMGPFLVDTFSGNLIEGKPSKEVMSIRTLDRGGGYILGNSNEYITKAKNYVVTQRPIAAHVPMFWQLAEGSMRITPTRVIIKANDSSLFNAGTRCTPNFDTGTLWRIKIRSTENCSIRFIFDPYSLQEFMLNADVNYTVVVGIASGVDKITAMSINATFSSSNGSASITDWSTVDKSVYQVQYCMMTETTGIATWQGTGLILKPMFLNSDLLKMNYDSNIPYDSGKVYF